MGLEINDVLLHDPDRRTQVAALFEQDPHRAVVQHRRRLEAFIQDEQGVLEGRVVAQGQPLAVDEHLQPSLVDARVHEEAGREQAYTTGLATMVL